MDEKRDSLEKQLLGHTGAGKSVLALACPSELIKELRRRGSSVVAGPPTVVNGNLARARYDIVVAADLLEQVSDPLALLISIRRQLRLTGRLIAWTANIAHGDVRLALLEGRLPNQLASRAHHLYTRETLEELLGKAGFVIETLARHETSITSANAAFPELFDKLAGDPDASTSRFGVVAQPIPRTALPLIVELRKRVRDQEQQLAGFRRMIERDSEREDALRSLLLASRHEVVRVPRSDDAGAGHGSAEGERYERLVTRIREAIDEHLPQDATVLVFSKGDETLLDLNGRRGWHFPQTASGDHADNYPLDSQAAISHLEALKERGAEYLVVPSTALRWLEHSTYADFGRHVINQYHTVLREEGVCVVFALTRAGRRKRGSVGRTPSWHGALRPRRPLAACTIISRNYLSHARVLAKSFLEHEPGGRFYLLVVDRLPEGVLVESDIHVVQPEELRLANFHEMCFKYDVVEFSTAVKPTLLSLLMEAYGEEQLLYLDPDILITAPLDAVHEAVGRGSVTLIPHILKPIPMDAKTPSEQDILISGVFNLGFLGLRRSAETAEFLAWWAQRLEDGCRIDVSGGLFTDQKWVDLVPGIFSELAIIRDPTYNVAFWNLHERALERRRDTFLVNGRPLAFFHASGFDPENRHVLSKHQNRIHLEQGSALGDLLDRYADLQVENGYLESSRWEYGFSRFDDGIGVNVVLRQLYLALDGKARASFGNPFKTGGKDSFLRWATTPRAEPPHLSPFMEGLYRLRYDVAAAFPDLLGDDREPYLEWARTQGSIEMGYEPDLVQSDRADTTPASHLQERSAGPPIPALGYEDLVRRIRDVVTAVLPQGATVAVVSKGDANLITFEDREGWHFPQLLDGVYAGYYPADSAAAIEHLEGLRRRGADFLLFPQTASWWLDHPIYEGFGEHLGASYKVVVRQEGICTIFALGQPAREDADTRSSVGPKALAMR